MAKPQELEGYWERYAVEVRDFWARARARHDIPDGVEPHVFPWGEVPVFADLMLFLLLQGGKRSTAHLELEHEISGKPPRKAGDYSVVLDGFGRPGAVIRTARVEIKPFKAVDKAFCEAESEGGGSILYWKQGHWAYYEGYCRLHGCEMTEDTPMVYEYFELIEPG